MNIEFRMEETYLDHLQYRVYRIGERQSLGFISIRETGKNSIRCYYFFPDGSAVLNRAELIEIGGFLKSISDPEQPARAMIELESLPPSGRFHGN